MKPVSTSFIPSGTTEKAPLPSARTIVPVTGPPSDEDPPTIEIWTRLEFTMLTSTSLLTVTS
jgi:hypothetical protein